MAAVMTRAAESKSPEFLRNSVRHLCLEHGSQPNDAKRVLSICTGTVDLGAASLAWDPTFLPTLAGMRLQRMAGFLTHLFGGKTSVDLTHPGCAFITHLDVFDHLRDGLLEICAQIPRLPALTHLTLDHDVSVDTITTLLIECLRLQVLFLGWTRYERDEYEMRRIPHVYDERFVIGLYVNDWSDWEAAAKGLPDLWSLAGNFVARKRKGEIEAALPWGLLNHGTVTVAMQWPIYDRVLNCAADDAAVVVGRLAVKAVKALWKARDDRG
ncbi:hypothetical protein B0H16DRAFT_1451331 [Mycena metata]|uniref:Uncharacterized protein n=1 Tax=Mycena metata TaxID=1033252 RepID=A0AAD7JXA4_9AGAR|nr:hypothetical protein B0H16DRAFT_1451331 [Mycena metata]